jgi:hypothetical protein
MPAPIPINSNEQAWIKQYLQETYDIAVVDAFDCKALSDLRHRALRSAYVKEFFDVCA